MTGYPNLKGVVNKKDVEQVKAGSYSADYVNWSRTMQLLRDNAPGWLPELVQTAEGGYVHRGGVGGFLLIRFVHEDGSFTPGFPQAIMDNRNQSVPLDKITSRDITDTHRRGVCMAAALAFGLAYELWAKMPLESGFADKTAAGPTGARQDSPADGQSAAVVDRSALDTVVEELKTLDQTTDFEAALEKAATSKYGAPVNELSQGAMDELTARMNKYAAQLKAAQVSGGAADNSPSSAPPESPSAGEKLSGDGPSGLEGAPDAPAEELFKAPTRPRGSKRKAAA